MVKRDIIEIDEEKCNGCGLCVPACQEKAIQIIDGKAKLIDDKLCDGLGNCLDDCPQNAITITKKETVEFDEEAVNKRIKELEKQKEKTSCNNSCPGAKMLDMRFSDNINLNTEKNKKTKSQLRQWPVQLMLVPENAPYFQNSDLLITADCVAYAYADYHSLLKNHSLVITCPKLDNSNLYTQKLAAIINKNKLKSITIAYMEVPCCMAIVKATELALSVANKDIPVKKIMIGINGKIKA